MSTEHERLAKHFNLKDGSITGGGESSDYVSYRKGSGEIALDGEFTREHLLFFASLIPPANRRSTGDIAYHIPTGQVVELVEHYNLGEGWMCQPLDIARMPYAVRLGSIIGATYSELLPVNRPKL